MSQSCLAQDLRHDNEARHTRQLGLRSLAWSRILSDMADETQAGEIYDSIRGTPHGGFQSGRQWNATNHQTWGATGYLGLVYGGLFGMQFEEDGIRFEPHLPSSWGDCQVTGLTYRKARLNIALPGSGSQAIRFEIDGQPQDQAFFPATLVGEREISVRL